MAPSFELVIASQSKPFPWAPLATAVFINAQNGGTPAPITITPQPVALLAPAVQTSNAILTCKSDGTTITETTSICATLATQFPEARLWTKDLADAIEVTLLGSMQQLTSTDPTSIGEALKTINETLLFSMHPVKYAFTVADLCLWGAIKANPLLSTEISSGNYIEIERWYKELMESQPITTKVYKFVKDLTAKPKTKVKTASFKLEGAEQGKVVTRFPPEPSGYLHIGHAKAAILNETAARDYDGTLILRFDDTNPSKERSEFQESQLADLHTLGIIPDKVSFTSDYFDQIEELGIKIIELGKAYCDDTLVEEMRKERMDGIESKSRNRSVEENLRIFNEMKLGSEEGRKYCVRAKISIDNKNKALRDPVIFRCNNAIHHRTGDKYKMYPTYDFACPIVDSLEGVTHALRTLEYKDRDAQYAWMLKTLSMRSVRVIGFSRLNFVKTVLSKRKLQWFVDQHIVSGWDDPRFPTVRGVMRKGCVIEALRKFIISQGPSKNINNLEWASFWAENKKVIDPIAKRFTCISTENRVPVTLVGGEGVPTAPYLKALPCHKKNPDLGEKQVYYSKDLFMEQEDALTVKLDEEITLMDWGNAFIKKISKNDEGIVTALEVELHLQGDFKKTDKKITWIANVETSLTPCILTTFDHLITKDKLEENDKIEDFVNHDSVSRVSVLGDVNMKTLPVGSIIQFERKGYFRLDRAFDVETGKAGEFFNVPDGKTVNRYGAKA